MSVVLAHSNYGKSRVRLLKVTRGAERHEVKEVAVAIQFEGDFENAYTDGDNSRILPTDTMKNTVYALARQSPVCEIEEFGRALVDHFLANNSQASRVRVDLSESLWDRIAMGDRLHTHAFVGAGSEQRIASVVGARGAAYTIESGIDGLLLLKTTGSGFAGFIKDQYTTLPETNDRVFATSVRAQWTWGGEAGDYGACWRGVRQLFIEIFADHDSRSVQATMYEMGKLALDRYPDIVEMRLSLPNKHYLLFDIGRFGLENENEIFVPTDEPYGLIEATIRRA